MTRRRQPRGDAITWTELISVCVAVQEVRRTRRAAIRRGLHGVAFARAVVDAESALLRLAYGATGGARAERARRRR